MKNIFLFVFLFISSFVQSQISGFLPTSTTNQLIKHTYYTLSYSAKDKQAEWVIYLLTKQNLNGTIDRKDEFKPDPLIKSGSASLDDYKNSGYDRGHLAPAADMKLNHTAMSESFYLSNMSPQSQSFNRGIWKNLEEQLRTWAKDYDSLYIVTGGTLKYSTATIGAGKVTVPKYFYKVIMNKSANKYKEIALILPNEKGTKQLKEYVVTIDSVEKLTGIDFFSALPDNIENKLEKTVDISKWSFGVITENVKDETNVQCKGVTNEGNRCKSYAKTNGYCKNHKTQNGKVDMTKPLPNRRKVAVQCSAITQKGSQCSRKSYSPNGKCWQHGGD